MMVAFRSERFKFLATLCAMFLVACGGGPTDRQETLDRLRGLGASATPLVSTPSTEAAPVSVDLKLHYVIPAGEEATVTVFTDDVASSTPKFLESEVVIDATSFNYQDFEKIRVLDFKATLSIPTVERFTLPGKEFAGTQVRYAFTVSSGEDSEVFVGTVLVFPAESEELQWQHPTINIAKPVVDERVPAATEVDLLADITNPNTEDLKLGWFSTSGEIANRRSSETTWTTTDAKVDVLIATIRGKKSKGFDIKVMPVTVE